MSNKLNQVQSGLISSNKFTSGSISSVQIRSNKFRVNKLNKTHPKDNNTSNLFVDHWITARSKLNLIIARSVKF